MSVSQQSAEAKVADLVGQVFGQNPPRYDRDQGAPHYITLKGGSWDKITFHQKRYDDAKANASALINCYDCAAYLQVLLQAEAFKVRFCYMRPFGYLKKTPLIGRGDCNNPFVSMESALVMAQASAKRSGFGNHAFCEVEIGTAKRVADACAGPHKGTENRASYVAAAVDTTTPNPPKITAGTTADITDYYGVDKVDSLMIMGAEMEAFMVRSSVDARMEGDKAAFAEAVQYRGITKGAASVSAFPLPLILRSPQLQGWKIAFVDTAVGYPESSRYWRLERGKDQLTVTAYVSSTGREVAHDRFLILGAVHQMDEPPYAPGPVGLGEASARLVGEEMQRLFWVEDNVVIDLRTTAAVDLAELALAIGSATRSGVGLLAERGAPGLRLEEGEAVRVGETFRLPIGVAPGAIVDFALGDDRVEVVEADEKGLVLRALAPGAATIGVAAADPETLISQQLTAVVRIVPV